MSRLSEILEFNDRFVQDGAFEAYRTSKFPDKKLLVLSCMDTRLTELLPRAMNLKNGDAKMVKTAGAVISHPFGSIMRSLLVAIYELGVEELMVVGHWRCGMASLDADRMLQAMADRGITQETILTLQGAGVDLHAWLQPVKSVEESVKATVAMIRSHPLVPAHLPIEGLVMDPDTGKLDRVSFQSTEIALD